MKNLSLKIAALCAAAGLMFSVSQAATVDATFVGGSAIRSDSTSYNGSGEGTMTVGQLADGSLLRGVMQFSLADIGIPQGATIESVKLFIGIASKDTSSGGSVPRDMEIGLYGLTQNFTPGSVTWDNASKDDPWQTAGGVFDASPLDTEVINSGDGAPGNYVFSSASLTALVQQSLDSRDDLIDLILKLTTEATGTTDREVFRFGLKNSLDGNVATYVPRLEITFAQVPEPSTVALMIAVPVLGLALLRRRSRR